MTKKANAAKEGRKAAEKKTAEIQSQMEELQQVEHTLKNANDEINILKEKNFTLEKQLEEKKDRLGEVLLQKNDIATQLSETSAKLIKVEEVMKDAGSYSYTCSYTHTHTHTYIYIYIYVHIYVYVSSYMHTYDHICTYSRQNGSKYKNDGSRAS